MKGKDNYIPSIGERVLISPPNCDNIDGYVYDEYEVLWKNDIFILFGNEGKYPNLYKLDHVHIKPLPKKRNLGYYWVYGPTWADRKRWMIYYWDGNYFWNGGEDFSEDCFIEVDENKLTRNKNGKL